MGDSGETCASAFTLGIGHPPGYPLYTMAAKLFSFIPAGDIAYRINIFSSLSAVLAVIFLFLSCFEFIKIIFKNNTGILAAPLATAIAFAFSGTFWFEAGHAKGGIYTLAVMIVSAGIYFALKFLNSGKKSYFYICIYTAGFMPFVHFTTSLAAIFLILVVLKKAGTESIKRTFTAFCLFCVSFITPLLYIFIRAYSDAVIKWSDAGDFTGAVAIILRKAYISTQGTPLTPESFLFKIANYVIQYGADYFILLPFVIFGLFKLMKINTKIFYTLAAFVVLNVSAVAVFTGNSFSPFYLYVNKGFYLTTNIFTMILASFGMYCAVDLFGKYIKPAYLWTILIAVSVSIVFINHSKSDLSMTYTAYDHAENIEKTLGKGSTLLCGADVPVFNILYMKYVRKRFNNIKLYDLNANLFDLTQYRPYRGYMSAQKLRAVNSQLAAANPGNVYTSEFTAYPEINIKPEPYGIIFKLVDMSEKPRNNGMIYPVYSLRDYSIRDNSDIFCREIIARYMISHALYLSTSGDLQGFENYRHLAETVCGENPVILSTIASAYFYGPKNIVMSERYLEKAVAIDPYYIEAIRLLTHLYTINDRAEALKWADIYIQRSRRNTASVEEVKNEFGL
jgi:hypothetical protein